MTSTSWFSLQAMVKLVMAHIAFGKYYSGIFTLGLLCYVHLSKLLSQSFALILVGVLKLCLVIISLVFLKS